MDKSKANTTVKVKNPLQILNTKIQHNAFLIHLKHFESKTTNNILIHNCTRFNNFLRISQKSNHKKNKNKNTTITLIHLKINLNTEKFKNHRIKCTAGKKITAQDFSIHLKHFKTETINNNLNRFKILKNKIISISNKTTHLHTKTCHNRIRFNNFSSCFETIKSSRKKP